MSIDIAQPLYGQNALNNLLSTIQILQKRKKNFFRKELEKRVNDLEQYSKMDNLIISGFNVQYKSYVRSVSTHDVDEHTQTNSETETIESKVIEFLKSKNIPIDSSDMSICQPFKSKYASNMKPSIVLKLKSRKTKQKILSNAKKLRGSDVYINEHLTRHNADLARKAREYKRKGLILSTWTKNYNVIIRTKGQTPEQCKVITIHDDSDFIQCGAKIHQSCSFVSNRTIVTDLLDSFMLILYLLSKFEMYLFNMNHSCSYTTIVLQFT